MNFDLPKDQSSIIKVIGVGGGGSNAVNHMFKQGIKGVDFIVCNTDSQALDISPVPIKVQLGQSLTEGRGAGSIPEVGKNAAIENLDELRAILEKNTTMVFITAGMGGGTGTGAAPVIARLAKEMGILTVGIVTVPFTFEGRKRMAQATDGLREMREAVDTLLVIRNDKLREIHGNLSLQQAFAEADDILTTAAKGIAEVISVTGAVNVDMNDVKTVMSNSGVSIMAQASAGGDDRALSAVKKALESPLLNDNDIEGAKYILLNITYGELEVMMDEVADITDYIQEAAGSTAEVIWGYGKDESLGDKLSVTIIATGFRSTPDIGFDLEPVKRFDLVQDNALQTKPLTKPLDSPVGLDSPLDEPYLKAVEPVEIVKKPEIDLPKEEAKVEKFNLFDDEPVLASQPTVDDKVEEEPELELMETEKSPEIELSIDRPTKLTFEPAPIVAAAKVELAEEPLAARISGEMAAQLNRDRLRSLREIAERIKSPEGLSELEREPAYKRRSVKLENTIYNAESEVSRYHLTDERDEDGRPKSGLRPNNPYLHDKVD